VELFKSYLPVSGLETLYLFIHNCLCVLGESMTPHPSFPPDLFLHVNLGTKGAQKFFKDLGPSAYNIGYPSLSDRAAGLCIKSLGWACLHYRIEMVVVVIE
jgi:hypothetical protein